MFDYYVDEAACAMAPWAQRVPRFVYDPLPPLGGGGAGSPLFVATVETTRLSYLLGLLAPNQHHVMFVGSSGEPAAGASQERSALHANSQRFIPGFSSESTARVVPRQPIACPTTPRPPAGTGKTAIMREFLRGLNPDATTHATLNLNSHQDGPAVQALLEAPLEKKAGMRYGPPGSKRLVYFVDDINMPAVDKYDTQSAVELMRQSIDYNGWCAHGRGWLGGRRLGAQWNVPRWTPLL